MEKKQNEHKKVEYEEFYKSNIETYNSIFEHWNEKRNYYWKPVKKFLEKVEEKQTKKLLDVGCGNGRHLLLAESLGFKKNNIFGIDVSENQIKSLKQKNYNVKVLDMKKLSLLKQKFDVIINIASFHHILTLEEQKKVLEEQKKILLERGKMLLSIWIPQKSFVKKMLEKNKFKKINRKVYEVKYTDHKKNVSYKRYYYFFEKEEIKKLLEEYFFIKDYYEEDHNLYFELEN